MSRKRIKQYLMLLTVVGLIAVAANGSGTFASFSAQVTNKDNTFATGSLYLHQTQSGTECDSEWAQDNTGKAPDTTTATADNTNNGCSVLFDNVDISDGSTQTAVLGLNNAGSIDASHINVEVSGCTAGANNTSEATFGTFTCGDLYLRIEQVTDNTGATASACAFGPNTGSSCTSFDADHSLADSAHNVAWSAPVSLVDSAGTAATLASTDTKYYAVEIEPNPNVSGNTYQNRKVKFSISWTLTQA